jgi:cobalt/nickel transport protein
MTSRTTKRTKLGAAFIVAGLLIALALAIFASPFASSHPDGLESAVLKIACAGADDRDACLAEKAGESRWSRAPLPDYGGDAGPAMSGLIGVVAVFVIGYGLVVFARARRRREDADPGSRAG